MVQGALKQATALLGKYKGDQLARLLKAWALKGSGKQAAALEVSLVVLDPAQADLVCQVREAVLNCLQSIKGGVLGARQEVSGFRLSLLLACLTVFCLTGINGVALRGLE